jgi:hypothetical protein
MLSRFVVSFFSRSVLVPPDAPAQESHAGARSGVAEGTAS